jgi:hypothetical protein
VVSSTAASKGGEECVTDLAQEFQQTTDLLWLQAGEDYRQGLTRKTMALVHFFSRHIPQLDYIFKTDDDCYVNITQMQMELVKRKKVRPTLFYGYALRHRKPIRDKEGNYSKWFMTEEEYSKSEFPTYASGFLYAVSKPFADCIVTRRHMAEMPFIPWEDVAMGILAVACKVKLVDAGMYWQHFEKYEDYAFFPYDKYKDGGREISILHGVTPEYMSLLLHHKPLPPPPPLTREGN